MDSPSALPSKMMRSLKMVDSSRVVNLVGTSIEDLAVLNEEGGKDSRSHNGFSCFKAYPFRDVIKNKVLVSGILFLHH